MTERVTRAHRSRFVRSALWWLAWVGLALLGFRLFPQWDAAVSGWFYRPDLPGRFWGESQPVVLAVYQAVPHVGRWATILGLVACLMPRRWFAAGWPQRWRARAPGLLAVLLLGLGFTVNWALKENVGRPRPVQIQAFGGEQPYRLVGEVSNGCARNCSFVSGHAATGFVWMAVGLGAAPAVRRRWYAVGALAGALVGAGRIVQGGHFLSDIVFAGLTLWGVSLLVRWLWVRWRHRRRSRAKSARSGA